MVPPPKPGVSASDPEPYTIHVPQSRLDTLKQKLALLSLPDELEGSEWDLGVPLKEVKRLKERWESGFDWRAVEERVNGYPNFWTRIGGEGKEGLGVHFLHQRSTREGAVPLLFVHGCEFLFLHFYFLLSSLFSLICGVFSQASEKSRVSGENGADGIFDRAGIIPGGYEGFGAVDGGRRRGKGVPCCSAEFAKFWVQ